ncbi:MAG: OadG family transporter subunit [Spirochaetota bacterium]
MTIPVQVKGSKMLTEAYTYTLFTAIFGMGVVFMFLGLLCVLMIALKSIFKQQKSISNEHENESALKDNEQAWIAAAVTTYLSEEGQTPEYSVDAWKAERIPSTYNWFIEGLYTPRKIGTYK